MVTESTVGHLACVMLHMMVIGKGILRVETSEAFAALMGQIKKTNLFFKSIQLARVNLVLMRLEEVGFLVKNVAKLAVPLS